MIVANNDTDLEVSDTCVRNSPLSRVLRHRYGSSAGPPRPQDGTVPVIVLVVQFFSFKVGQIKNGPMSW